MTAGPIGLIIGTIFGVTSYRILQRLAERVEKQETKKLLRVVSLVEVLLMPALGFLIGAYVFET